MIRAMSIFVVTYTRISTQRTPFIGLDRPTAAIAGGLDDRGRCADAR
jgi:hypothetical protein